MKCEAAFKNSHISSGTYNRIREYAFTSLWFFFNCWEKNVKPIDNTWCAVTVPYHRSSMGKGLSCPHLYRRTFSKWPWDTEWGTHFLKVNIGHFIIALCSHGSAPFRSEGRYPGAKNMCENPSDNKWLFLKRKSLKMSLIPWFKRWALGGMNKEGDCFQGWRLTFL